MCISIFGESLHDGNGKGKVRGNLKRVNVTTTRGGRRSCSQGIVYSHTGRTVRMTDTPVRSIKLAKLIFVENIFAHN